LKLRVGFTAEKNIDERSFRVATPAAYPVSSTTTNVVESLQSLWGGGVLQAVLSV